MVWDYFSKERIEERKRFYKEHKDIFKSDGPGKITGFSFSSPYSSMGLDPEKDYWLESEDKRGNKKTKIIPRINPHESFTFFAEDANPASLEIKKEKDYTEYIIEDPDEIANIYTVRNGKWEDITFNEGLFVADILYLCLGLPIDLYWEEPLLLNGLAKLHEANEIPQSEKIGLKIPNKKNEDIDALIIVDCKGNYRKFLVK